MNGRLRLLVFSLSLAAACAHPPAPPRLAPGQAIAVLPPNNRTGNPLFVSGASFLDRYVFHAEVVTVGDVLAGEARFQLAERGFRVIPGQAIAAATKGQTPESPTAAGEMASRGKLDALALYLEIRQWEPDGSIADHLRDRRSVGEPRRPGDRERRVASSIAVRHQSLPRER